MRGAPQGVGFTAVGAGCVDPSVYGLAADGRTGGRIEAWLATDLMFSDRLGRRKRAIDPLQGGGSEAGRKCERITLFSDA